MLDEAIKTKLRDPAYLDLHLAAVAAIRKVGVERWYDAHFHRRFQVARLYLAQVRPDVVEDFEHGFDRLLPPPSFATTAIGDLFDTATQQQIREHARAIPAELRKTYEIKDFGRHIVHDDPWFVALQAQLLPRISDLVGIALDTGYNFLSLYGGTGKCDPHMDEPTSMFTLDYCIEQSEDWPIWFSRVTNWPTLETMQGWDPHSIKADPALAFRPHVIRPGQALLFNGSSQWHYRDRISSGGFCSLLFFHYYPKGCDDLIAPQGWARHFAIPELEPLCELFRESGLDGLI